MDEVALKTPTKDSTPSSTIVFMTPTKNCRISIESASSFHCKKRKSLPFSTSPKSCCTSTENARSIKKRESHLFSTPTTRKRTLVASPLTPKGQVRARFPKAHRRESQCNPPSSVPSISERKSPFFLPVKKITAGFDPSGEILALSPLPNQAFRPVEVDGNDLCFLPIRESVLVTPQEKETKRTLPFLHFMCKESIHETRPLSLKRLSSQRRPSLLFID
jgi:hypothetical protein